MSRVPPAHSRPRQSEASLLKSVITLARSVGWLTFHAHDSRRQVRPGVLVGDRDSAGLPDLLMVRDGVLLAVELKSDRGRLRPAQRAWLEALRAVEDRSNGALVVRTIRPSQWAEIEALLTGRPA